MTLKEFLMDYASDHTKELGEKMIAEELNNIPNEKVRQLCKEHLIDISNNKRDFRF